MLAGMTKCYAGIGAGDGKREREREGRKARLTQQCHNYTLYHNIRFTQMYLDLTTCGSMDHPACNRMKGAIHQAIFLARGLATLSLSLQVTHHSYSLSPFSSASLIP